MKTSLWIAPLLLSLSLPASAAWTFVERSEEFERYIERDSVQRDGQWAQVWLVDDLPVPDKSGVRSMRSYTEYDCDNKNYRVLYLTAHSERMTQGAVLFSSTLESPWKPVRADTLGEMSMDMACEDDEP